MFAYCRNNPVCRRDITGTTDVALPDDGTELLDEKKSFEGGKTNVGDSSANVGNGHHPQKGNTPGSDSSSGNRRTPDQQALHDLAREIERAARQGKFITQKEAQLLDAWAKEYGVYQGHGTQLGSGSHWGPGWDHTHIYNVHVPFVACY